MPDRHAGPAQKVPGLEIVILRHYYWHSTAASANNSFAAYCFLYRADRLPAINLYRNGDFAMKIRPLHDRVIVKRMEEER
ncbi:MAG: hypothetical protein ACLGG6_08515, partial [Gammaproteobacteria bacterium]